MDTLNYYLAEINDIVTYNGNTYDIQINYGMLLLAICCWCFTVLRVFNTIPDFCFFLGSCLYILFTVQIATCMLLSCIGISGVWCAMVGFSYRMWVNLPSDPIFTNKLVVFGTFGSFICANVYCFRMEGTFTTICHIVATWLGYEANNMWLKTHQLRDERHGARNK